MNRNTHAVALKRFRRLSLAGLLVCIFVGTGCSEDMVIGTGAPEPPAAGGPPVDPAKPGGPACDSCGVPLRNGDAGATTPVPTTTKPAVDAMAVDNPTGECRSGATLANLEKSCQSAADCFVAFHTTSCCGTQAAIGLNESEKACFSALEKVHDSSLPRCGCYSPFVNVEDGTMLQTDGVPYDPNSIQVECRENLCRTVVRNVGTTSTTVSPQFPQTVTFSPSNTVRFENPKSLARRIEDRDPQLGNYTQYDVLLYDASPPPRGGSANIHWNYGLPVEGQTYEVKDGSSVSSFKEQVPRVTWLFVTGRQTTRFQTGTVTYEKLGSRAGDPYSVAFDLHFMDGSRLMGTAQGALEVLVFEPQPSTGAVR